LSFAGTQVVDVAGGSDLSQFQFQFQFQFKQRLFVPVETVLAPTWVTWFGEHGCGVHDNEGEECELHFSFARLSF
jgi:hypothetical protein